MSVPTRHSQTEVRTIWTPSQRSDLILDVALLNDVDLPFLRPLNFPQAHFLSDAIICDEYDKILIWTTCRAEQSRA